jgi:hypothetical protein
MEALSARLTQLGDAHAGVQVASLGWILSGLLDPDGHEIRFYTTESHKKAPEGQVYVVENSRRTAPPRNQEPLPRQ